MNNAERREQLRKTAHMLAYRASLIEDSAQGYNTLGERECLALVAECKADLALIEQSLHRIVAGE
jgi:hypothetical protein